MRVLHIVPNITAAYGGPTASLQGFVKAGQLSGTEVDVAAPLGPGESAVEVDADRLYAFPSVGEGSLVVAPSLWVWLYRNADHYDVLHIHGLLNPLTSIAIKIGRYAGGKVLVRPFGTLSKYSMEHRRQFVKKAYFKYWERPSLRKVAGLHFTTEAEQQGAAWHQVGSVSKYVVPSPFTSEVKAKPYYGKQKVEQPVVLLMARFHPVKAIESLLKAWPKVQGEAPSARLVIAGDGKPAYTRHLRHFASRLDLNSVSFPGFVRGEAKASLLQSASVFVLPSYHENFGISVLEALAAGLPVVISGDVQLSTFVEKHELGLVSERDPAPLATAIVQVLSNEWLQRRCAEEGPQRVEEHFSPEVVGRQLRAMYEAVQA